MDTIRNVVVCVFAVLYWGAAAVSMMEAPREGRRSSTIRHILLVLVCLISLWGTPHLYVCLVVMLLILIPLIINFSSRIPVRGYVVTKQFYTVRIGCGVGYFPIVKIESAGCSCNLLLTMSDFERVKVRDEVEAVIPGDGEHGIYSDVVAPYRFMRLQTT